MNTVNTVNDEPVHRETRNVLDFPAVPVTANARRISLRVVITAIPITAVNITAVIAQFQFMHAHLPTWGIPGQVLFASALESIAIMLSYFAHESLKANDSSTRLRYGSYLFALVIATMNGSHYLSHGKITFASVAVFTCSAVSPWLWGIFSRRQSREALKAAGLIESQCVKLGSARWAFHPVKSFRVFRWAVWHHPDYTAADAIRTWESDNSPTTAGMDSAVIREWARQSGRYSGLSERGRIPKAIRADYVRSLAP